MEGKGSWRSNPSSRLVGAVHADIMAPLEQGCSRAILVISVLCKTVFEDDMDEYCQIDPAEHYAEMTRMCPNTRYYILSPTYHMNFT